MSLDALKNAMPDYAKDTKLNLGSVIGTSTLPKQQVWGAALACAVTSRSAEVLREIDAAAREHLTEEARGAALSAASIMAMNNVYYRGKHLIGDPEYANLPARLRMQVIAKPGVDKVDFELWCLAVSAITGCGVCLQSHEKTLRSSGVSRETVHEALRIASVIHAAAVTLDAESVLSVSV
ncbi:alkyl hydroperoxide reductase subunit D [Actinokineospora alba]|uniref:Alkyl hydroperoxide reductase AhpD n=1 Tax=Actinokineospora alba TaxID=504798 RepID=A0A1H0S7U8_9PSEU|nr:carboxymuconolactone decarboxylase family protein [Actinokineospora alba]TDP66729.1 alkyl hydroperoxide reductase subunit D [Actinokineospora alba]SDI50938.1 alkyl hydroperoxide reductase subunit D [Actinokineospora alba]SDP37715.1 alkyl hydroperoxide reductase subunit D [Actinokineospora alba]